MKTMVMAAAALAASTGLAGAQDIRFDFLPRERHRTETVLVGYRDVWVDRTVTVYETRTVYREVIVGYDHCRRPIYACRPVRETVPVCRTERVCEKQPIYETRACREKPRWGISFLFGR